MSKNEVNRYRNENIFFKVTEAEKSFILDKMNAIGMSNMGKFLTTMAIRGECKVYDSKELLHEMRANNYYVGSISKSVNQIAKLANATGYLYQDDLDAIRSQLDEIMKKQTVITETFIKIKKEFD